MSSADGPGYDAVSLKNIRACRAELGEAIIRTPVLPWRAEHCAPLAAQGTEVWLKLELFQHTGTFKARGALNSIRRLAAKGQGIAAVSAGNHAVAVAYAAREMGLSAKIVMVNTADPARVRRARDFGAELVFADFGPGAFALAEEIARAEGRVMIHPFEGPYVAQGTGTLGLEFVEQVADLDAVLIGVGGGGLCGGAAAAIKQMRPDCLVFGVEPQGADTMARSFAAGAPVTVAAVDTIADSLAPPMSLPFSFGLCRRFVDEIVTVTDDQIREAMAALFQDLKLAVEPGGAAAAAAVFGPLRRRLAGKRVGVVICGSNIELGIFANHLSGAAAA